MVTRKSRALENRTETPRIALPTHEPAAKLVRQTTTELVLDAIRQRILSGQIPPGAQLRQEAIGEELGVSRIPVREAIRRLEAEGMVEVFAHRGAFVCALSSEEIREAFEIRLRLEPWLFSHSIRVIGEASLTQARAIVSRMDDGKIAEWGRLNWEFHKTLYLPAGRDITLGMLERLHERTDRYFRYQVIDPRTRAQAHAEHSELIEICVQRDVRRAAILLKAHIETAATQISGIVEQLKK